MIYELRYTFEIKTHSISMQVRRLTPAYASEYRALMLEAYADESQAFTSTVAEREPLPLEWWRLRISHPANPNDSVFGAFDGLQLVGVAGVKFKQRERIRHKAELYGMFILPAFRGKSLGRILVEAVLEHASSIPNTRAVQLTVIEPNSAARRLYESCGFLPFGTEPYAKKLPDGFVSVIHMWCPLGPDMD